MAKPDEAPFFTKMGRRLAGLKRLELATFRVTGERSNQTELQPPNLIVTIPLKEWQSQTKLAERERPT